MHYRVIEAGRLSKGDAAQTGRKATAQTIAQYLSAKKPLALFAVWRVTKARPDGASVALYRDGKHLVPQFVERYSVADAARDKYRAALGVGSA